jgi:hypothetical protein
MPHAVMLGAIKVSIRSIGAVAFHFNPARPASQAIAEGSHDEKNCSLGWSISSKAESGLSDASAWNLWRRQQGSYLIELERGLIGAQPNPDWCELGSEHLVCAVQHQDNSVPFDYRVAVVTLKLSMKRWRPEVAAPRRSGS